jgi:hypothetical protein
LVATAINAITVIAMRPSATPLSTGVVEVKIGPWPATNDERAARLDHRSAAVMD